MHPEPHEGPPLERLRKVWTPDQEIEEIFADLSPGSQVDSYVRHFLHATLQQHLGSVKLDLSIENRGTLRWEIVHGPAPLRNPEATVWVDLGS